MLILTRHVDETITIGEDITITVVHISPTIVRLGITAPRDVRIVRGLLVEPATTDKEKP